MTTADQHEPGAEPGQLVTGSRPGRGPTRFRGSPRFRLADSRVRRAAGRSGCTSASGTGPVGSRAPAAGVAPPADCPRPEATEGPNENPGGGGTRRRNGGPAASTTRRNRPSPGSSTSSYCHSNCGLAPARPPHRMVDRWAPDGGHDGHCPVGSPGLGQDELELEVAVVLVVLERLPEQLLDTAEPPVQDKRGPHRIRGVLSVRAVAAATGRGVPVAAEHEQTNPQPVLWPPRPGSVRDQRRSGGWAGLTERLLTSATAARTSARTSRRTSPGCPAPGCRRLLTRSSPPPRGPGSPPGELVDEEADAAEGEPARRQVAAGR